MPILLWNVDCLTTGRWFFRLCIRTFHMMSGQAAVMAPRRSPSVMFG
ncbi:MAG TPA: hypothetical protein VMF65_18765 [Acidimicrobiales bacterium]|nr:hypothetical protein [Acidimicrobiales bacterium]